MNTELDDMHKSCLMQLVLKKAGYAYLGVVYVHGKVGYALTAVSEDLQHHAIVANGDDYVTLMDLATRNRRLEINYIGDVRGDGAIIDPNCYGQFLDALLALHTKLTIDFFGCKVLLSGNPDDLHILEVEHDLCEESI